MPSFTLTFIGSAVLQQVIILRTERQYAREAWEVSYGLELALSGLNQVADA